MGVGGVKMFTAFVTANIYIYNKYNLMFHTTSCVGDRTLPLAIARLVQNHF
jgi:hypothetical protein